MSVRLAIAFWKDDGLYPRAGRAARRQESYLRNVATMAATWRRVAPDVPTQIELCTNVTPPAAVSAMLARLDVTVVRVAFASQPPDGYFDRFPASLYTLDVLAHYATELGATDRLVLVDPDVVWLRHPQPLLARVDRDGLVVHEIPYAPDRRDLGVTRRELGRLFGDLAPPDVPPPPEAPAYIGGELVAARGDAVAEVSAVCREGWAASLDRHARGERPLLHTEEHVLSYAVWRRGIDRGNAADVIRRLWTRPATIRNVRGDEYELLAWHVLTEKTAGLWRLYDDLEAGRGPFAAADEDTYRRELGRRLSVAPTLWRRAELAAGGLARRALGRTVTPNEG